MSNMIHFAPLQGYTDAIYRDAHAEIFGGVEIYYTPFVRLEKNSFRNKDVRDISPVENRSAQIVPQLIAATPDEFRRIASLFRELGYTRADINLGCPFPMQARLHRGSGILPYREEVVSLLDTICEFPEIHFSVKMRLGWENREDALNLLPLLNTLPLSYLTVHPRVGVQQYKGVVDQEGFSRFYDNCRLPLFYNGDLNTLGDIYSLTSHFPRLQGVMLGRGLLARPWLALVYKTGKELPGEVLRDKLAAFHSLLLERSVKRLEGGDHQLLSHMKTVWDYLLPEADKKLRKKVIKSNSLSAYRSAVTDLFNAMV